MLTWVLYLPYMYTHTYTHTLAIYILKCLGVQSTIKQYRVYCIYTHPTYIPIYIYIPFIDIEIDIYTLYIEIGINAIYSVCTPYNT